MAGMIISEGEDSSITQTLYKKSWKFKIKIFFILCEDFDGGLKHVTTTDQVLGILFGFVGAIFLTSKLLFELRFILTNFSFYI